MAHNPNKNEKKLYKGNICQRHHHTILHVNNKERSKKSKLRPKKQLKCFKIKPRPIWSEFGHYKTKDVRFIKVLHWSSPYANPRSVNALKSNQRSYQANWITIQPYNHGLPHDWSSPYLDSRSIKCFKIKL